MHFFFCPPAFELRLDRDAAVDRGERNEGVKDDVDNRPSAGLGSVALHSTLWLVLGGWLGAWALFAFGVAPTAFRVLPSSEVAGSLIAPLLRELHLYGIAAGLGLCALAPALGRGSRVLVLLPIALAGLCAFSEFWVTASIGVVRPEAFGEGSMAEAAARFSTLHATSRAIYSVVGLGLIALTILHARADAGGRGAKRS